jgi:hypothetical protein
MISDWKIKKLEKLGQDFKCSFYQPPFEKNILEASFDIQDFKETPEFKDFLVHIDSLELKYEYAKHNDRIFLVIAME